MKILLLADHKSVHTVKWARSLSNKGFEIMIASFAKPNNELYKDFNKISVVGLGISDKTIARGSYFGKLEYLLLLSKVKEIITSFKPDILHAHYASSYGLLGALTKFHPYIISVWGSDVFDFPKKSFVHRTILKYNLKKADKILSTSRIMAKETNKYTNKHIEITPFGIDSNIFKPLTGKTLFDQNDIVIGTVKSLETVYGLGTLIKTFKTLTDKYPRLPLKLLIVGGGSKEGIYKKEISNLKIENQTVFAGKIFIDQVPQYHNMMDIEVFLSNSESFGVAVIEASACEKPVVVSNVGGLPEVVEENVTGLIVKPNNPEEAAKAIEKLILDPQLRTSMGKKGRKRAKEYFNWEDNVNQMINIYNSITKQQNEQS